MKYTVTQRTSPESDEPTLCNALTIDVEDYYQVSAFEADVPRDKWGEYPQRVQGNTLRLLEKLAAHDVSGTFFIVGWVAEKYPDLVREIRAAGHEVGSHSYWHRLVYQLTPDEFRSHWRGSRDTLENILGESVRIYRAPSFSITRNSLWAFEILVEERFEVDSSVFPVYHDRYGLPDANPAIHRLETRSGFLWECPPSVRRQWGINVPVSGGGYFRLYPLKWSIRWLRQVNKRDACPFVFYVHPWEIDPEQPRLRVGSRLSRWRHYLNLATTAKKLDTLLDSFRFGTLTDAIRDSVAWKSMATNEPLAVHKLGGIVVSPSLHETGSTSR